MDVSASKDNLEKMRNVAGNAQALAPQIANGDVYCGVRICAPEYMFCHLKIKLCAWVSEWMWAGERERDLGKYYKQVKCRKDKNENEWKTEIFWLHKM